MGGFWNTRTGLGVAEPVQRLDRLREDVAPSAARTVRTLPVVLQ